MEGTEIYIPGVSKLEIPGRDSDVARDLLDISDMLDAANVRIKIQDGNDLPSWVASDRVTLVVLPVAFEKMHRNELVMNRIYDLLGGVGEHFGLSSARSPVVTDYMPNEETSAGE